MNNLNPFFCKKYEKGIITYLSIEEQIDAILQKTKQLDQKNSLIYEQLMGELEPKGLRIINFNKLSEKERFELEKYFDHEIAPYLSANIISKQQPFPFMKNRDIYAVAQEVAVPILDPKLVSHIDWMFETMMKDDEKGKIFTNKGIYEEHNLGQTKTNSQEIFYDLAYKNAENLLIR